MNGDDTAGGRLLGGRYRLGGFLGRGGAAVVYEGVDLVLGRRVAVKLYRSADAVGRYRFVSEARLLAGLSHPGLVTVFDVDLDDDHPYLVLRLVDGPTLRDVMNAGPLPPEGVAMIGSRLAGALAYVHQHDVIHRDIKPSNVLLEESGQPLLGDFGLARAVGAVHLTVSGEYVGTPAYIAPEQITDVDVGPPADVYSLGLVLLECLTGRTEYTGSAAETALARLSRPPRIPEDLPAGWRSLLAAMTAQEPDDRPSATRCASLLTGLAEGRTVAPAEPTIPRPRSVSRRGRARRPAVHAGVAALALAAAATVTALAADGMRDSPAVQPGGPASGTTHAELATPASSVVPDPQRMTTSSPPGPGATVTQQDRTPVPPPATTQKENPGKGNKGTGNDTDNDNGNGSGRTNSKSNGKG